MRILLISPFGIDDARGNSVATARLAHGFRSRGHFVTILSDVVRLSAEPDELTETMRAVTATAEAALIMHATHGASAAVFLRKAGIPYVVSFRGTDVHNLPMDTGNETALHSTLEHAARIIVFHDQMLRQLNDRYSDIDEKVIIVPNGLDLPDSTRDFRAELGIGSDAVVMMSLAGLRDIKRPLFALSAVMRLITDYPGLRFVRAGPALDPGIREALDRIAAESPWLIDLGQIPHDDVSAFLRMGDIFVSTSRAEGMPHAVNEAMMRGRALLLSDISGHRAMAEPDVEALFFDDEVSFCSAARRLIQEPDLRARLGNAARIRLENRLAAGDEISDYLRILLECRISAHTHRVGSFSIENDT